MRKISVGSLLAMIFVGSLVAQEFPPRNLILSVSTTGTRITGVADVSAVTIYDDGFTISAGASVLSQPGYLAFTRADPAVLARLANELRATDCVSLEGNCGRPMPDFTQSITITCSEGRPNRWRTFTVGADTAGCDRRTIRTVNAINAFLEELEFTPSGN